MTNLDPIREAHEPESVYFDVGDFSHRECRMCRQRWTADRPCDTRVVLDALGYCAEDRDVQQKAHGDAAADADRLAEALRTLDVFRFHLEARHWDKAREALRLHDAAKETSDFDHPDLGTFALRQEAERD